MNTDTYQNALSKKMQRAHDIFHKLEEHEWYCQFNATRRELYKYLCQQYDLYTEFQSENGRKFVKRQFNKFYKALWKLYKYEGVKLYEKL